MPLKHALYPQRTVHWTTFIMLWRPLLPQITCTKHIFHWCWQCQKKGSVVVGTAIISGLWKATILCIKPMTQSFYHYIFFRYTLGIQECQVPRGCEMCQAEKAWTRSLVSCLRGDGLQGDDWTRDSLWEGVYILKQANQGALQLCLFLSFMIAVHREMIEKNIC